MRITVLVLLLGLAACDDDDGPSHVQPDAGGGGVQVSGCDDPAVWASPVAEVADASADVGGNGSCFDTAQFPVRRALLSWRPLGDPIEYTELQNYRVCWRVTDASAGSGWTTGQTFTTTTDNGSMNVMGFAKPVTIEGRVLDANNTLAFAIEPMKIELRPKMIVVPAASNVIAVMAVDAWATHDAVHLWGLDIPTDEVLDAATIRSVSYQVADPITLHREGGNVVRRTWSMSNTTIEYTEVMIGPGTSGRLSKWGNAAVVDNELVIFGRDSNQNEIVKHRIALAAAPLEIADDGYSVTLHLPGALVSFDIYSGASATLPVGEGVLVPAFQYMQSFFFDGTTFRRISRSSTTLELDSMYPYTPRAEDVARIGKPLAEMDSVIIGEHGFLVTDAWRPWEGIVAGPGAATVEELFGDGRLGPLSSDNAAYVVVHEDGGAELYAAPYGEYCEPI